MDFGPRGQLGLEPIRGLRAEAQLGLVVWRRLVLAFSIGGEDGGVGGVIEGLGGAVGRELRICCIASAQNRAAAANCLRL